MQPRPGNEYMIPDPNPKATKKRVTVQPIKKKVKGGEKAHPMPIVGKNRSVGGGIVGPTGVNVNSAYNTY